MIEIKTCPLCGGNELKPHCTAYGGANSPLMLAKVEGISVLACVVVPYVECIDCGMVWQTPRMADDDLQRYYADGIYRRQLNQSQSRLDEDESARSLRIFNIIKLLHPKPASILDIGCSRGYLLKLCRSFGMEIMGVEENSDYVLSGVPAVPDLKHLSRTYELITLVHVLEHIPNPVEFLKEVTLYLRTSGRILIEIPSIHSTGGPYRLAHLTYMTPEVLQSVCEKAGLQVISISTEEHTTLLCKRQESE